MDFVYRKLTLTFNLTDNHPELSDEVISERIQELFNQYLDGRNNFYAEVIAYHLGKLVEYALCEAIEQKWKDKVDTGMTPHFNEEGKETGRTAAFIIASRTKAKMQKFKDN